MEVKKGDLVSMNNIGATVTKVLDPSESKNHRCWIEQKGKSYCVFISDLKPYKG